MLTHALQVGGPRAPPDTGQGHRAGLSARGRACHATCRPSRPGEALLLAHCNPSRRAPLRPFFRFRFTGWAWPRCPGRCRRHTARAGEACCHQPSSTLQCSLKTIFASETIKIHILVLVLFCFFFFWKSLWCVVFHAGQLWGMGGQRKATRTDRCPWLLSCCSLGVGAQPDWRHWGEGGPEAGGGPGGTSRKTGVPKRPPLKGPGTHT